MATCNEFIPQIVPGQKTESHQNIDFLTPGRLTVLYLKK